MDRRTTRRLLALAGTVELWPRQGLAISDIAGEDLIHVVARGDIRDLRDMQDLRDRDAADELIDAGRH